MSYSFQFTAATKEEAKQRTAEKFDEVLAFQPSHEKDKDAALANANAMIDLLGDVPDNQEISVSCSGSIGWQHDENAPHGVGAITWAGVSCSAGFTTRPAQA